MGPVRDPKEKKQVRLVVALPRSGKVTKEFLIAEMVSAGILGEVEEGDWVVSALAHGQAEILVNYRE